MAGRTRSNPYIPGQQEEYKISRSKIELFMQCPRCFWLDARLKIKRPDGPPFSLNKAVDELLKKEFDTYRSAAKPHPIMIDYKINAVPFQHEDLDKWRENFVGVGALHKPTNLYIFGAVDDLWVTEKGELIVVDYKATAKTSEVSLDADWQVSYKRQVEVYQWLLRQNGFKVNDMAIFIYTNGKLELDGFNDHLEFVTKLIEYNGDDSWIEGTIVKMKQCLEGDIPPVGTAAMGGPCDFCEYAKKRTELTLKALKT
ncbi:MAG: PD-(D/E)XK nuclease family protein [Candidatus Saccharimonadales bacterium]